jgi:hypothetical protein
LGDGRRFFDEVVDYRESGRCGHELSDIIWLVLYGFLADGDTFEDIDDYACDREAGLRQFWSLPAGISSHDTLNRVFRRLDPPQVSHALGRGDRGPLGCESFPLSTVSTVNEPFIPSHLN